MAFHVGPNDIFQMPKVRHVISVDLWQYGNPIIIKLDFHTGWLSYTTSRCLSPFTDTVFGADRRFLAEFGGKSIPGPSLP
jgi:hypothetical protein